MRLYFLHCAHIESQHTKNVLNVIPFPHSHSLLFMSLKWRDMPSDSNWKK